MRTTNVLSSVTAWALCGIVSVGCGGAAKETETAENDPSPALQSQAEQYMGQAGMALSEGDSQGALANYLAAAELYDQSGEVTVERAEAHFLAAEQAYQLTEREMAVAEYDKAVEIYLRFSGNSRIKAAIALNNMGTLYKEMQNKSRALNCWNRALDIYRNAPAELRNDVNIQRIEQNIRDLEAGY